jgi:hypothetical protein
MTTRPTTSTFVDKLDSLCMLDTYNPSKSWTPQDNNSTPNSIDKSHAFRFVLLLLILLQMAIPMPSYGATYSVDQLRVYTHSRVVSYKEFRCIDKILWKESRYNYLARNGSHFGIGQMHSKHYQSRDPYTQIDMTIKYIHIKFKSACNALAYHQKHGFY